jgi:HK97 gp10 family phage protein
MIQTEWKSNVANILYKLGLMEKAALDKLGSTGVNNIKKETPVDTGELQAANTYTVDGKIVTFRNGKEYAAYVEYGTIFQSSNPFMRRGINNSRREFINIIVSNIRF